MANLIVITGPISVGKMTVAEALKEKIGYNLMVNHDSIEVSDKNWVLQHLHKKNLIN
ncbi:deoxynucleoside kinase [uncultured Eubacterium sp.]|uniref:deoxynucleoside kinase n=1 Tax=uncultured Eubacterium sp. TaxID=165185 RepID=UPI0015BB6492|nr:deoxynucleoside kinase [uncultured Eubacterium sp.]